MTDPAQAAGATGATPRIDRWRAPAWTRSLAFLFVPLVVCGIAMKAFRVAQQDLSWSARLLSVTPDLLFFVGLFATLSLLLDLTHGTRARIAGVIAAQILAFLVFAIDVLAFGYFRATGLVLDYAMFAFSLGRVSETAPVVGSEINFGTALFMISVPLWIAIAPWWRKPMHTPPAQRTRREQMLWIVAAMTALGLPAIATTISVKGVSQSLINEPVLHLISGYVQSKRPHVASDAPLPPPRRLGPKKLVPNDEVKKHNVVVIVLESTRADATTPYTPKLATTPSLAALAKDSTVIERAYAIVPHTSKALVAILCGIEPRPSLEIVEAANKGMPANCLARLLAGVGYDTAFFQAPKGTFEHRDQLVKNMGYARFLSGDKLSNTGFAKVNYFGYEDAIMLAPSETWLKTEAREPFFATYLTSASHHPYGVPPTHVPQAFSNGKDNDYLNAVHYVDSVIGKIIQQYKDAGLYERTIFVVVGDHGEAFGEHGLTTHDDVVYEEGLRVPLIVRAPENADSPKRIVGPLNQLSIAPTVISLLGLRTSGGSYEAKSIYAERGTRPLYAACYRNAQCITTIRGDMKLLYFFGDKPTLLFNLKKDPRERANIAAQYPALVKQWTDDVMQWTLAVEEAHKKNSRASIAHYVSRIPPKKLKSKPAARFGELVDLYRCSSKRRQRGYVKVTCVLHVIATPNDRMRFRVRGTVGIGEEQTTIVFDHKPVRGLYPLREWKPGEYITDSFDVRAPSAWEFEDVTLCLELQAEDGSALPVTRSKRKGDCVAIGTVEARERPAATVPSDAAVPGE